MNLAENHKDHLKETHKNTHKDADNDTHKDTYNEHKNIKKVGDIRKLVDKEWAKRF